MSPEVPRQDHQDFQYHQVNQAFSEQAPEMLEMPDQIQEQVNQEIERRTIGERIRASRFGRMVARSALAATVLLGAGGIAAAESQPAEAYSTICKTDTVSMYDGLFMHAKESIPICYNGSKVWQNGHITPGIGVAAGSANISWYGSYHDASQNWLGFGENFTVNWDLGVGTEMCAPRWYINANGGNYGGKMNCT